MKIETLFFEYEYVELHGEILTVSCNSQVVYKEDCCAKKILNEVLCRLDPDGQKFQIVLQKQISEKVRIAAANRFCIHEESYGLEIYDEEIILSSPSNRGLIYAAVTLAQIIQAGKMQKGIIFDYPDKDIRGYRVYTPGIKSLESFKHMVDMLVYYKYNSIIIEVGGAMEYKKHPIINEKWTEFCRKVNKSPNEADRIQGQYSWAKNSIHSENGDGSYISQELMRDIINYCKERELKVIPEVPSLSHSDYIVMAYPELNERKEDEFPDTYCPSNPKSYEVLFDIIDEVAEVFQPEYINIGHDEFYTAAKCEKCKEKDPVDLYVTDITKINDYLKRKNIKTIMWGEKVYGDVQVVDADGKVYPVGGAAQPEYDIPRLAECAGKIPKDIMLLQWYWSLCTGEMERKICDMGYRMVYGNFRAIALENYRERISIVDGGFVSNWGSVEPEYMQRNGQNYSLLTTAYIFWNRNYDNSMKRVLEDKVKKELYEKYKKSLGKDIIEIVHTTDYFRKYKAFYCGYYIVPDDWIIGWYTVTYTDKETVKLPVIYGYNIRSSTKDGRLGVESAESIVTSDIEVMGATYPFAKNGKMYYKTAYVNPCPDKEIDNIVYSSKTGIEVEILYEK